jgi:Tfp pilus assembly protein PilO
VSLTDRDRKILLALIPIALVVAYWFLLLAPKRQEATSIQSQLTQAQSERDTAQQRLAGLSSAKQSFARDYATVVYLGKSIPTSVDMPSLLVQLDRAARGTGIRFSSIKAGDRTADAGSATTAPAPAPSGSSSSSSSTPSSSPSTTSNASSTTPATSGAAGNAALDSIPLDFEFSGNYFELAQFFHRMKRFVRVSNDRILIRGRLMTLNTFSFETDQDTGLLKATVHATVYLTPKDQGASAGATQQGPAGSTAPPAGQSASASSSPTPPAASVIAR